MRIFFLLASLLFSSLSYANPVNYVLTFVVETGGSTSCSANPAPLGNFGCLAPGDTFKGTLSFDDSALLNEGVVQDVGPSTFNLQFGALFFTNTRPSFVTGFKHLDMTTSMNPSVMVENGELVDLLGYIYSHSDAPYIDFFQFSPNLFREAGRFHAVDFNLQADGSLSIEKVPEPATVLLVLPALLMIASRRRTRVLR